MPDNARPGSSRPDGSCGLPSTTTAIADVQAAFVAEFILLLFLYGFVWLPMIIIGCLLLLAVIETMNEQVNKFTIQVLDVVRTEATRRRLMTVPGVGPLTALAFLAGARLRASFFWPLNH
ncbi:transposase (plasmid) [Lichenicola cladoniae]|uniref:Transposase n=1 Tax=Lichenicola cladoniae TaxID=1484109 RepID=A0A6M8HYK6_9PROT|nr:transposase [Acetobacteraceae bacterium]QKE93629.1 transposase [Lichenicola cladoniae]